MSETVAGLRASDVLAERESLESVVGRRTLEILETRRRSKHHRRGWLVRRFLLAADILGLMTAFLIAELAVAQRTPGMMDLRAEAVLFLATVPAWVLAARLYGLYSQDDQRTNHVTTDEVADVFHMVTVCTWLFFVFSWLTAAAHPGVEKLLVFWAIAIALVPLMRAGARGLARRHPRFVQNTVIVGAGDVGQALAEKLLRHPEYGINVVGFIDSEPKERHGTVGDLSILGPPERLPAVIRAFDIERVIVAFSRQSHDHVLDLIRSTTSAFVQVDIVPRYFELIGPGTSTSTIEGIPVIGLPPRALGLSSRLMKRTMDLVVAVAGLALLTPFFVVAAVLIKLDSSGPVLFRQRRIGREGREFTLLKLRTMTRDAEAEKDRVAHLSKHAGADSRMFKIVDDPRVTRVGRQLRRLSLDELPQLWNVVRGDMSLVGPRPLIPTEDIHVEDWGRTRLDLRPGMTGLWQVLGRSDISFEEMVRLDYLYVTTWSLWHDVRLLCGTVPLMLRGGPGSY
jgi:exopolysaccharide biosynthesis polyprenyl glycosylphosphotransferase